MTKTKDTYRNPDPCARHGAMGCVSCCEQVPRAGERETPIQAAVGYVVSELERRVSEHREKRPEGTEDPFEVEVLRVLRSLARRTPDGEVVDQPIDRDENGQLRFRANPIVEDLLSTSPLDMNEIAMRSYPRWARVQLAQLIGYSLSGYSELSYVSDDDWARVVPLTRATED